MAISKNDYLVLAALYNDDCNTELKSYTINKLQLITQLSTSKIRKTIKIFLDTGYIDEGCLQRTAKTYYITKDGINKIIELKGE